jgi:hypothetical protein
MDTGVTLFTSLYRVQRGIVSHLPTEVQTRQATDLVTNFWSEVDAGLSIRDIMSNIKVHFLKIVLYNGIEASQQTKSACF